MYKHHEESIEKMKEYFREQEDIALILIGSVAKGTERADSDLDCAVILSYEEYKKKEKNNVTTETIDGLCTYKGGYFEAYSCFSKTGKGGKAIILLFGLLA